MNRTNRIKQLTPTISVDAFRCHAFKRGIAVGAKVFDHDAFLKIIEEGLEEYPRGGFMQLPDVALEYVAGSLGPRSDDPEDYLLVEYRGEVGCYLRRHYAYELDGNPWMDNCAVRVETVDSLPRSIPVPDGTKYVITAVHTGPLVCTYQVLAYKMARGQESAFKLTTGLGCSVREATKKIHDELMVTREEIPHLLDDINKAHAWVSLAQSCVEFWRDKSVVAG